MTQERAVERASGTYEVLVQLGAAIADQLDAATLARLACQQTRTLLSAETASLWLYAETTDTLWIRHHEGGRTPTSLRPGEGLVGSAFAERRPVTQSSSPACAVPLLVGRQAVGVLAVESIDDSIAPESCVETLSLFAALLAPALELIETKRRCETSEQRFQSMFDYHPDAVFEIDLCGRVTRANSAFVEMSGYSSAEQLDECRTYIQSGESERFAELLKATLRGASHRFASVVQHRDGHLIDVGMTMLPVFADGSAVGVFVIARDATEQHRARAALEASEQRFRAVWEHAADAMVLSDPSGTIELVNPACYALFGTTANALVGESFERVLGAADPDDADRAYGLEFAKPGSPGVRETVVRRTDGEPRVVEIRGQFIDRDGQRLGMISVLRDVTERVRAEQERDVLLHELATAQERAYEVLTRVLNPGEQLSRARRRSDLHTRVASLTPRELDVLRELAIGKTNAQIADALGLSPKAARNRVAHVLAKLGVADRTKAAVVAVELGLTGPAR